MGHNLYIKQIKKNSCALTFLIQIAQSRAHLFAFLNQRSPFKLSNSGVYFCYPFSFSILVAHKRSGNCSI